MNVSGFTLIAAAREAEIGTIMLAVAVFDVTSVSQITIVMKMKRIKATGSISRRASCCPIHNERPLAVKP